MYDDGGFPGGKMKRPALKQPKADIQAGKFSMVVDSRSGRSPLHLPRFVNEQFKLISLGPQSIEGLMTLPESLPQSLNDSLNSIPIKLARAAVRPVCKVRITNLQMLRSRNFSSSLPAG
jgi:hypothetical protein